MQITNHYGHPVVYEKEPIMLVKIPVNGERLDQSVLLHPRYAPSKRKYEKIAVRGFRRGRTLDILLDEPIVVDGKEYGVLNFKGVGADADEQMVIRPDGLWYMSGNWKPEKDNFSRCWGALLKADGIDEFYDRLLPDLGISFVPHIAVNHVPRDVCKLIAEKTGVEKYKFFSQLVRASSTNIRIDMPKVWCQLERDINPSLLADKDAKVLKVQGSLKKNKKTLCIYGRIAENRFIDGIFVDAENYVISYPDPLDNFAFDMLYESLRLFTNAQKYDYLKCLEEKTGITLINEEITSYDEGRLANGIIEKLGL